MHGRALEDDVVHQVQCDRLIGKPEERCSTAGTKHLKALPYGGGMTTHFEQYINSRAFCGGSDERYHVDSIGIEDLVRTHGRGRCAAVWVHFSSKDSGRAARVCYRNGH